MALHLNLYHEVQKQSRARQRDPVKLAILGLLVVTIGLVVFYLYRLQESRRVGEQLAGMQAEWSKLEQKEKTAEARKAELENSVALATALVTRIEDRFYWAPMLDRLLRAVPAEVQLTQVQGRFDAKSRRVTIDTDGLAAGSQPRIVAEELRLGLGEKLGAGYKNVSSTFTSLEDGTATVPLDGGPARTAVFSISVSMELIDAATPVEVKPRRERRKIEGL